MDTTFLTGLIGSLILVTGAAWPDSKKKCHPIKSVKNWLFASGGLVMLIYAILGYLNDGTVFFVLLESLIAIASVMMMLNVKDAIATIIISFLGSGFIIWSLYLFEGYNTVFFIIGLSGVALGYAFKMATIRRNLALTAGSLLIALFSYFEANWIFFWVNLFFGIFSGYYLVRSLIKK